MLEESAVREIHVSAITDTVAELAVAACCRLPDVMYRAIESSVERGGLAFRQGRVRVSFC